MVFRKIFGSSIPGKMTTGPTMPRIKINKDGEIKIKTGPTDLEDVKDTIDTIRKIGKIVGKPMDYKDPFETFGNIFSTLFDGSKDEPKLGKGDVIGVSRGYYEHYGVYIGNNRVIHYTSLNSDVSMSENKIMETGMDHFLRDANEFFILDCTYKNRAVKSKPIQAQFAPNYPDIFKMFEKQKVYSSEETVERAKSRLGETKYSLAFNNCEHFAIWCKTGLSKSHQVDQFLEVIGKEKVWRF